MHSPASPLFLYMYTIVPSAHLSGIGFPFLIRFVISVMGLIAHFFVALYASPSTPSLPCAFFSARFLISISMSCSVYSLFNHVSISGLAFKIFVRSALSLISFRSSGTCVKFSSYSFSAMWVILGSSSLCSLMKRPFVHSAHLFSISPIPWHSFPSLFFIAAWLHCAFILSLLWYFHIACISLLSAASCSF